MPAKARSRHRFQRTGGVYQCRCRNRLPTHENRFGIPNRLRCGIKLTCPDRGVSALRVPEVVPRLVSISLSGFLCRVEMSEFGGADISLCILAKVSVFRVDSYFRLDAPC